LGIEKMLFSFLFLLLENLRADKINTGSKKPLCHLISALFWGYYAASSGSPLPTFRENVSVLYLRVKKYFPSWTF
jgi:hypothetical protein